MCLQPDPKLVCERCGAYGAYPFDGRPLCAGCYETQGSCCPEFCGRTDEPTDAPSAVPLEIRHPARA